MPSYPLYICMPFEFCTILMYYLLEQINFLKAVRWKNDLEKLTTMFCTSEFVENSYLLHICIAVKIILVQNMCINPSQSLSQCV